MPIQMSPQILGISPSGFIGYITAVGGYYFELFMKNVRKNSDKNQRKVYNDIVHLNLISERYKPLE